MKLGGESDGEEVEERAPKKKKISMPVAEVRAGQRLL